MRSTHELFSCHREKHAKDCKGMVILWTNLDQFSVFADREIMRNVISIHPARISSLIKAIEWFQAETRWGFWLFLSCGHGWKEGAVLLHLFYKGACSGRLTPGLPGVKLSDEREEAGINVLARMLWYQITDHYSKFKSGMLLTVSSH